MDGELVYYSTGKFDFLSLNFRRRVFEKKLSTCPPARLRLVRFVTAAALLLPTMGLADQDVSVTASGMFKCSYNGNEFPIKDALVEVLHADKFSSIFDGHLGTGFTKPDGSFVIAGKGRPGSFQGNLLNVYVRLGLIDSEGRILLSNELDSLATFSTRNDAHIQVQGNVNLGTWVIGVSNLGGDNSVSSIDCAAWDSAYRAYHEYRDKTVGSDPPAHGYHIQHYTAWDIGGTWTDLGTTHWLTHFPVTGDFENVNNVAFHEFGHSVRHSFDGDRAHFDADVLQYHYPIYQTCDEANEGHAFNEGWALFWDWATSPFNPKSILTMGCDPDLQDWNKDNNVARALKIIAGKCVGGDGKPLGRKDFVAILQKHPGEIHSFKHFRELLKMEFPNCDPDFGGPGVGVAVSSFVQSDRNLQATNASMQRADLAADMAALRHDLVVAQHAAATPLACNPGDDCRARITVAVKPFTIQWAIDVTQLAESRLRQEADLVEDHKRNFRTEFGPVKILTEFDARQTKYYLELGNAAVAAFDNALKAVRSLNPAPPLAEIYIAELGARKADLQRYLEQHQVPPATMQPPLVFDRRPLRRTPAPTPMSPR